MKFNYRFQKILDIKNKLEENKKMEISNIISNINNIESEINMLDESKKDKYYEMKDIMTEGTSIATVRRMSSMLNTFDVKMRDLSSKNVNLNIKLQYRKDEYKEIMKDRKIFENIRDKDLLKYNDIIKKEEEKFLDQIVTFKYRASN